MRERVKGVFCPECQSELVDIYETKGFSLHYVCKFCGQCWNDAEGTELISELVDRLDEIEEDYKAIEERKGLGDV